MWDKLFSLFAALLNMWSKLSEEDKQKIISAIVDTFTDFFRKQYQSSQENSGSEEKTV
ncbi:hypothetical protein [Pseudomonas sp. HY13-MNA-CIBAN-0226]|uniref:hypothetical protein n=1 Tax=Pseudomonas sp. HY13-MNA-CIBAN-0226 TaxID=3140473 RepID=UPI00332406C7